MRFFRDLKLSRKLTIAFVVVAILPLTLVVVANIRQTRSSLREQKVNEFNTLSELKVKIVEDFSENLKRNINLVQDFDIVKNSFSELEARSKSSDSSEYQEVKAQVDNVVRPFRTTKDLIDVLFLTADGILVYTTEISHPIEQVGTVLPFDQDAFFGAEESKVTYSEIFKSEYAESGFEMLVRGPIENVNGDTLGFVVFAVDMGAIYKEVENTAGLGETGEVLLGKFTTPHKGQPIGEHKSDLQVDHVFFLNSLRFDSEAALVKTVSIGEPLALPMQLAATGNNGSGVSTDYRGKEVVAAWRHVPMLDWGLVVKQDTSEAFSLLGEFVFQTAALGTGAVFLVLLLAIIISKSVSRPLDRLALAARKVKEGRFDIQVQIDSMDEVGALSQEFNAMVKSLAQAKESISSGEKEIELNYKNLEKQNKELAETKSAMLNLLEDAKELEEDLKVERDKARSILSSMGEGLIVIGSDQNIIEINPAAEKILEFSAKELVGKKWNEALRAFKGNKEILPKDRVSIAVMASGEPKVTKLEDDHYYISKTGKKIPLISITAPLGGDPKNGVVKVFKNAAVEKEARNLIEAEVKARTQELKQEQAQNISILENTSEGIVLTNSEGVIKFVNQAFTKMAGFTNKNLIGKVFAETVNMFDLKEKPILPRDKSDAAAITAEGMEMKVLIESAKGTKLPMIVSTSPVRVDGNFRGVVRVFHDFGEDLKLQQDKDDFFSIASHELRTPLTVISGNLDIISDIISKLKLESDEKQLIQDTQLASDRLIGMVNDFLNVSRIDQGRIKVNFTKVSHCKVLDSVIKELESLAGSKGIYLKQNCQGKAGTIMADENLLREILINLIGNSIKFTTKGGVTVDVKSTNAATKFLVRDTGTGIDQKSKKLLFQRFQQAMKRTLSREAGGTGLGLYISREFARVMGGDLLLVNSVEGKGSSFELTIPKKNRMLLRLIKGYKF